MYLDSIIEPAFYKFTIISVYFHLMSVVKYQANDLLTLCSGYPRTSIVVGSPFIRGIEQKLGGALAVKVQTTDTCGEMEGQCISCIAGVGKQKVGVSLVYSRCWETEGQCISCIAGVGEHNVGVSLVYSRRWETEGQCISCIAGVGKQKVSVSLV